MARKTAPGARRRRAGLTLVELMLMVAVIGILMALALPSYRGYRERVDSADAATDIGMLSVQVKFFRTEFQRYPNELSQAIQTRIEDDPWGNPYRYLNIDDGGFDVMGMVRKDKNLVPINSDFDLYSMGPDGATQPPLTADVSMDDVVRANDGAYVGLAEDY